MAPPQAPDPAAFAGDPRLAVCGSPPNDAEAIFEIDHVRDYPLHLPGGVPAGRARRRTLRRRPWSSSAPDPRAAIARATAPEPATTTCAWSSAPTTHPGQRVDIVDVDTTGLIGVLPEPTGTPFADDLAPWAERCGGVDARILDVYTFDHGTDVAASLALDPSPPELETDEPGAVIVYVDTHPFPPLGTPPPGGVTIAPREPLAPDRHDICVLVGADPATAQAHDPRGRRRPCARPPHSPCTAVYESRPTRHRPTARLQRRPRTFRPAITAGRTDRVARRDGAGIGGHRGPYRHPSASTAP